MSETQKLTRQQRLSEACNNCACELVEAVKVGGALEESKTADLIYQYMREFLHGEAEHD